MRIFLIVVLALSLNGCAFALMETESSRYTPEQDGTPYCTGTSGFAYWDWLFVAGHGLSALAISADPTTNSGGAIVSLGAAGIHAASAIYGHLKAGDCRHAREDYESWHRERIDAIAEEG